MRKKKTLTMWALWNYGRMMGVESTRRRARQFADTDITGDPAETRRMFRRGTLNITKVSVREI